MPTTHGPKFTQEASTGASFTLSWVKRRFGSEPPTKSSKRMSWDPKQPFINGTFNWMIPNLLIKHPFQTACLKFHIPKTSPKNNMQNKSRIDCQRDLSFLNRKQGPWSYFGLCLSPNSANLHKAYAETKTQTTQKTPKIQSNIYQ